MYKYSLFTAKNDVNCEELAKIFGTIDNLGGGGHAKAAGFQSYKLIFESNCTVHISNKIFSKNKYNIVTVLYGM
jgi:nanoRNase/pAp phosphatase (c-di-AMP/oligoRNAs hydrolase)